uniref:Uncharacterized protein n=1 Tax=Rhizophora mucronata TaxID=61149 RepID=A0A2P2J191_RHIMU
MQDVMVLMCSCWFYVIFSLCTHGMNNKCVLERNEFLPIKGTLM